LLPDPIVARSPRTLHGREMYQAPQLLAIVTKHRPDLVACNPMLELPVWESAAIDSSPAASPSVPISEAIALAKEVDDESVLYAVARSLAMAATPSELKAFGYEDGDELAQSTVGCQSTHLRSIVVALLMNSLRGLVDLLKEERDTEETKPAKQKTATKKGKKK
jgi:hypothetical protein